MKLESVRAIKRASWWVMLLLIVETGLIGYYHFYTRGTRTGIDSESLLGMSLLITGIYLGMAWLIAKEWRIEYSWKDPLLLSKVACMVVFGFSSGGFVVYSHITPVLSEIISGTISCLFLIHISCIGLEAFIVRKSEEGGLK